MAELNETDLRAILGDDYDADANNAALLQTPEQIARQRRARMEALDDSKFPASVTIFVGMLLVVAAWFTASGREFQIQVAAGVVIALLGVFFLTRILRKLNALRVEIAA